MRTARPYLHYLILAALCSSACSDKAELLTREQMMDPETCRDCHPDHYREWSGSMHAYAADDPVFLAMNRRGQRELAERGQELGDFCVKCHAPLAVLEGVTTDGLNMDEVPQHLKGVTCYFCHSVESVGGQHNNPLQLSDDLVMRGGIGDAIDNGVHKTAYSPLHDRNTCESSSLCGSCHDIVTPAGVHLERTFAEYQETIFAQAARHGGLSCGNCHMTGIRNQVIADFEGVPSRTRTPHSFPGVDVALTPWPEKEEQRRLIEEDLSGAIAPKVCVNPSDGGKIEVNLDNVFVGHKWPSGAGQDRRAWVQLVVTNAGGDELFESGVVAMDEPVAELDDPNLVQIRDFTFDENGDPAHMFWDVATIDDRLLPASVTNDCADPRFNHSVTYEYPIAGAFSLADIARIEVSLHIRPIGLDVLDDLIDSGDLEPSIRDEIPTFSLEGGSVVWTPEAAGADGCVSAAGPPQCPENPRPPQFCEYP